MFSANEILLSAAPPTLISSKAGDYMLLQLLVQGLGQENIYICVYYESLSLHEMYSGAELPYAWTSLMKGIDTHCIFSRLKMHGFFVHASAGIHNWTIVKPLSSFLGSKILHFTYSHLSISGLTCFAAEDALFSSSGAASHE